MYKKYAFWFWLGVALNFRLLFINRPIFGSDESRILKASLSFLELWKSLLYEDVYPPLMYYLLHVWLKIDASDIWIRLFFVLFGVGSCILIYHISKMLFSKKKALWAMAFSAISPLLIWSSQYTRAYGPSSFFILLSQFFYFKYFKSPFRWKWLLLYACSIYLAIATFYYAVFIFISQGLFLLCIRKNHPSHWKIYTIIFSVISFFAIPLFALAVYQISHNATNAFEYLQGRGLSYMGVPVGLYIRNIVSIFGLDPYLTELPRFSHFLPKKAWLIILIMGTFGTITILHQCFLRLQKLSYEVRNNLFCLFCLTFLPLLITFLLEFYTNTAPRPRYMIAQHCFLLIFFVGLWETISASKLKLITYALVIVIFFQRIGFAIYRPEVEYLKAYEFVLNYENHPNTCVVGFKFANYSNLDRLDRLIKLQTFFIKEVSSGNYRLKRNAIRELQQTIQGCSTLMIVYHGYDTIYGINRILENWISNYKYALYEEKKFRGMTVSILQLEE